MNTGDQKPQNMPPESESEMDMDAEIYLFMDDDLVEPAVEKKAEPSAHQIETPPVVKATKAPRKKLTIPHIGALPRDKIIKIATLSVLLIIFIAAFLQIPHYVEDKIAAKFLAAGFPQTRISDVELGSSSILAHTVKLDQYGFDEIQLLRIDVSWPSFILKNEIAGIQISGLHIGRDSTNILGDAKQLIGNMLNLPKHRISLEKATIDITTDFGELRVLMDATVMPDESGNHTIKARIQSAQYQLGFDSNWTGTLSKDGSLDLSAEVTDGRVNVGPFRISRFNGWIGTGINDGVYTLGSQMIAGSAQFMNIPLQDLSFIAATDGQSKNIIFRSGISSMPDTLFTADYTAASSTQSFNAILNGGNLGMLLDYIEEVTGRPKNIHTALVNAGAFQLEMIFQPEKRFVGGPLPLAVNLDTENAQKVAGNVLYYNDTFELRGSLETDNEMVSALQDYFKISSDMIGQNFIRLDGEVRSILAIGEQPPAEALPN